MEETAEERAERNRWLAVEQLANVVQMLADKRHEEKSHGGPFHKCEDTICQLAREAYLDL